VSAGGWLELDLLRQRRKDFGQIRPYVVPTGSLLRRGAVAGAVLPALLLLASGWLLLRDYVLTRESQILAPAAQKHAQVDSVIKTVQAEINLLTTENTEVALAMADVRSSSAFLTELQRIMPMRLKLNSILVSEQRLTLTGDGISDRGIKTLNAFMLELQASSFLEMSSVRLIEASLNDQAEIQQLNYTLKARFANEAAEATAARLPSLGAQGMALRLAAIRELGLLP
tara:strand:+ start:858 stop:1541 length:684 start_codon:yes stop_codon:yes gene_type:complete